jgi:uncharacterized protein YdaU (DUF1376 family)
VSNFDHWMKFNVGDYLADTMHLSTYQHGIYVMLIMHYFKRGELPDDEAALRRIAKVTSVLLWRNESPPVLALFRPEGGHLRHARIDAERAEAERISVLKRAAGQAGAARRWASENRGPLSIKKHAPGDSSRDDPTELKDKDTGMACAMPGNGISHGRLAGARASTATATEESPPVAPQAGRRTDGSNPRAQGTNPRATGDSPRLNGTNPRAKGSNPRHASRNAGVDLLREELADATDQTPDSAPVVPFPPRAFSRHH